MHKDSADNPLGAFMHLLLSPIYAAAYAYISIDEFRDIITA